LRGTLSKQAQQWIDSQGSPAKITLEKIGGILALSLP